MPNPTTPATPAQIYAQTMQGYGVKDASNPGGDVVQGYKDLLDQQAQYGQSAKLALSQQYQQALAQNQQSTLAAGLGNTTVLQAGARGINYDYGNSLLSLNDQLYQRQNQIAQAMLGYQGQQGLQTQQLGVQQALQHYQGGLQQQLQTQQLGVQQAMQTKQLANALQVAQTQAGAATYGANLGYQAQLAGYNNQFAMAQLSANQASQDEARQFGYQSSLQRQQYAAQAAMQQAQFAEQNYAQDQFGYY